MVINDMEADPILENLVEWLQSKYNIEQVREAAKKFFSSLTLLEKLPLKLSSLEKYLYNLETAF